MHKGIFITGTDTGVGKTFVAVGLLQVFREKSLNVCPMKPVETGCKLRKSKLVPEDTIKLIRASGTKESINIMNPYRLRHSLSPSSAAELEGVVIKKKKIFTAYNHLINKYDITLVEGAGGIVVPIYKKYLFIDLVKDLNLPLVIIARPGLGTINHTLLTIEASKNRGIKILGVIINYAAKTKKGLPEKTSPGAIEQLGGVPVLGVIPHSHRKNTLKNIFYQIAEKILNGF